MFNSILDIYGSFANLINVRPSYNNLTGSLPTKEFETDSEESDVSGSDGDDTSWISWFFDDDYIQDDFNLYRLSSQVPYYYYALHLILDVKSSDGDIFIEEQNELIKSAAEMLYGLIHLEKYKNYDFGRCPRVYCCGQACLPNVLSILDIQPLKDQVLLHDLFFFFFFFLPSSYFVRVFGYLKEII
ncbi:hypothetical protein UlMin_017839 [Ulmus minor]